MSSRFGGAKLPPGAQRDWFTDLYEDTSNDLLAFLMRRCSTSEDAADHLAETYRIAWEKRDRVPDGQDARPWLFGVARNVMRVDARRRERHAATSHELADALRTADQTNAVSHTTAAAFLGELSELDQEIITMLAWDELAPREVAIILGLSANVVRVRAHRARQQLRTRIAASQTPSLPRM